MKYSDPCFAAPPARPKPCNLTKLSRPQQILKLRRDVRAYLDAGHVIHHYPSRPEVNRCPVWDLPWSPWVDVYHG